MLARFAATTALLVWALVTPSQVVQAQCPPSHIFGESTPYPSGRWPLELAVADFNNDGIADIAVSNSGDGTVGLLLGQGAGGVGNGLFAVGPTIGVPAPNGSVTADFNADGRPDLAVAQTNGYVGILLGTGVPGSELAYATGYATAGGGPRVVKAGDHNGDGFLDLVAAGGSARVWVFYGNGSGSNGDGTFRSGPIYTMGGDVNAMRLADFNEDGILDVAVLEDSWLDVMLGEGSGGVGTGSFAAPSRYETGPGGSGVATGDFNSDDILDLVVSCFGDGTMRVFFGKGTAGVGNGQFTGAQITTLSPKPYGLAVADFDGDGIEDVAAGNIEQTVISVFVGRGRDGSGTGSFEPPVTFGVGSPPARLLAYDFDEDGTCDLAVTNFYNNSISVLLGSCLPLVRARPTIVSVRDVSLDQGGSVKVSWHPSGFDLARGGIVNEYWIWRSIPADQAEAMLESGTGVLSNRVADPTRMGLQVLMAGPANTGGYFWEFVASQRASALDGYSFVAATTSDSILAGNPLTAFFVQARYAGGSIWWNSPPDSGYSVDNLSPPTPMPFTATYSISSNALHWTPSHAPDLREFRLYRGTIPNFVPGQANLIAASRDTGYVDGPGTFYYKLIAVDVHGNQSRAALVSPSFPTGTLASLVSVVAQATRIELVWYTTDQSGPAINLYRRTLNSDWELLDGIVPDGAGYLHYEDAAVAAGTRYGYRLGLMDEGEEVFAGEVWAEVPIAPVQLAIRGASPNPILDGRLRVEFSLHDGTSARLELMDVAGRVLNSKQVGSLGPGSHSRDMSEGIAVRPGIYFLRLTQGANQVRARAVVIE